MYYNFVVQIPSEKGKILTKAKGGSSYVLFQYGAEYKPDKKYAIPKRTIIGKVDPSDPTKMFPNEKFQWIYQCAESACPVFWKSPVRKEEIMVSDR